MKRRTNAGIQDQDCHVWVDGFSNLDHLLKKFRLLLMPPRGINDDDLEAFLFKLCDTLCSNCDRVGLRIGTKVGDLGFCGRLPGLVESTRAECICTNNC